MTRITRPQLRKALEALPPDEPIRCEDGRCPVEQVMGLPHFFVLNWWSIHPGSWLTVLTHRVDALLRDTGQEWSDIPPRQILDFMEEL